MPREFFFESADTIARVSAKITEYNEAVNRYTEQLSRNRKEHRIGDKGPNKNAYRKYKIIKREDARREHYRSNLIKEAIREALNWYAVWLVVKQDNTTRKEVLQYRINDFIEVLIFAIEDIKNGIKRED